MSNEFGRAFAAHLSAVLRLDAHDDAGSRAAARLMQWFCADLATLAAYTPNPGFEVVGGLVVAGVPVVVPAALAMPIDTFAHALESAGVSGLTVRGDPDRDAVLSLLRRVRTGGPSQDRNAMQRWLDINGCDAFRLTPLRADPTEEESARPAPETLKAYGRFWYAVSKARGARSSPEVRAALRTLVERVEAHPRDAIGLAAAAAEDDAPATRAAVHGALLAIALGHRVGLARGHLIELGYAALIAAELPRGSAPGNAEAALAVVAGQLPAADGPLKEAALRRGIALHQYAAALTRADGDRRSVSDHLFARILAIALSYDALIHGANGAPMLPDAVLAHMSAEAGRAYDRTLLDVFAEMLGPYPLGTTVLLESGDVGVVYKQGPVGRPLVRLMIDRRGAVLHHGQLIEAGTGAGRRILGSVDPAPLGINPADALFG